MYNKKEIGEKIRPLGDNVLVRVMPPKEITKNGIYVGSSRSESFSKVLTYRCTVLALGPRSKGLKVGDICHMDVFAGTAIPVEGDEYLKIVSSTMVVGVETGATEDGEPVSDKFIPNFERVLIKQTSLRPTTDGGIILTKQQSSPFELDTLGGVILAVAPELEGEFAVGEKVRFEGSAGTPMSFADLEKEDVRVMPYHMVICKIDE
jgi:co-chaperonin GroES (HSP10)